MGIFAGVCTTYMIAKYVPNDFARTSVILDTVVSKHYEVALFGNSVLMNGVNTHALDKRAYNLGSGAQGLSESMLYYQDIPENVNLIVQFMDVSALIHSDTLSREVVLNFTSKGYVPNAFTISLFEEKFSDITFREQLDFQKSKVHGGINSMMRDMFKSSNALANYADVYSPYQYIEKYAEDEIHRLIALHGPLHKVVHFESHENTIKQLTMIKTHLLTRNIDYKIVILPIHPDMTNYTSSFYRQLQQYDFSLQGLDVTNYTRLLEKEDFIDHVHPNEKGREKLTEAIQKMIK